MKLKFSFFQRRRKEKAKFCFTHMVKNWTLLYLGPYIAQSKWNPDGVKRNHGTGKRGFSFQHWGFEQRGFGKITWWWWRRRAGSAGSRGSWAAALSMKDRFRGKENGNSEKKGQKCSHEEWYHEPSDTTK